jgi:hypothetical protein
VKIPWRRQTAPSPRPYAGPDPGAGPGSSPGPSPVPSPAPSPDQVPPELLAWANAVDVTRLSDKTVKQAEQYLKSYRHMTLGVQREVALRLRSVIEAQVSPPPPATIGSMDVIATVLSERRKILG